MDPESARRLTVIPIGVDLERFRRPVATPDPTQALGVGIIDRVKRWELAAAATRGTGVQLRLVGPIRDRRYAEELQHGNPHVQLLAMQSDAELSRAYQTSSFLVHPSRVELLSGAVLQALASGLPVIGAAPLRGVVEEGVTGWTTEATDSEESIITQMHGHCRALVSDPGLRQRMSEAARTTAERDFAWSRVVERHVDLYRRLLESGAITPVRNPGP